MSTGYISDGYTRTAFVDAARDEKSGLEFHPAVRFEFRPMLVADRAVLFRRIAELAQNAKGAEEAEKLAAKEMARRLVSWDLFGPAGVLVEITEASLLRVEPHLSARLFSIITGQELGDKYAEAERADAKNCETGCG